MTSKAELLALVERCEKASGPLVGEITAAILLEAHKLLSPIPSTRRVPAMADGSPWPGDGLGPYTEEYKAWERSANQFRRYVKAGAFLDAAMTLKHPGDLWCVGSMEDGPFARVVPALPGGRYGGEIAVHAETAENALTATFLRAAALRAQAEMTEGEG